MKPNPAAPLLQARRARAAAVPTVNDGHDRQLQQGLQRGLQGEQLGEGSGGERTGGSSSPHAGPQHGVG